MSGSDLGVNQPAQSGSQSYLSCSCSVPTLYISRQELSPLRYHGNTLVWTRNSCSGMLQHSVQEAGKKTPIKHSTEHNCLEMNGSGSSAEG
ncbi:hypothetical protein AVEN_269533-1 [Araneus ventricosus]|uniref:Uncharacterized protein n=1 Tax=Araneus ventricosus TaxID=182803 RepID=A0A4Y2CCF8_ARAVE|nr:hypothetical protein AVEN_269533-1 [Araneus ventricosus]